MLLCGVDKEIILLITTIRRRPTAGVLPLRRLSLSVSLVAVSYTYTYTLELSAACVLEAEA